MVHMGMASSRCFSAENRLPMLSCLCPAECRRRMRIAAPKPTVLRRQHGAASLRLWYYRMRLLCLVVLSSFAASSALRLRATATARHSQPRCQFKTGEGAPVGDDKAQRRQNPPPLS